jgi:hypothetical protein
MISNRESTRKDEKMISKAWMIVYFDKTILVLTLLRPSSSVRVVSESLGPVCGPTEYFLFLLGPPLRTASPDPSLRTFAWGQLSDPGVPDLSSVFPDRRSRPALSQNPPQALQKSVFTGWRVLCCFPPSVHSLLSLCSTVNFSVAASQSG